MPKAPVAKITLLGRDHAVTVPGFAEREELAMAWHGAGQNGIKLRRVYGAAVGICTRLGRESGAREYDGDVMSYGGQVYGWLREQGASMEVLASQALPLIVMLSEMTFPRESEVQAEKKDSSEEAAT